VLQDYFYFKVSMDVESRKTKSTISHNEEFGSATLVRFTTRLTAPIESTLYGYQTKAALNNFGGVTGFVASDIYPEIIQSIGFIKAAAARANYLVGSFSEIPLGIAGNVKPEEIRDAIVNASFEVAHHQWDDQFVVDVLQGGAGTSLHMNANEVIATRANQILLSEKNIPHQEGALTWPIHPNDHVNAGQSTNDVIPTALRLSILKRDIGLQRSIVELMDSFFEKAEDPIFSKTVQVGRTHLQDAVPITPSQVMTAYGSTLLELASNLALVANNLAPITLGATAVGTGIDSRDFYRDEVFKQLQQILRQEEHGVYITQPASYLNTTSSIGPVVQYSSALKNVAIELIKIANDIRLLASGPAGGIGEYNLLELQPGSSIMPGKVNPVIPELLNQACYMVIGNDTCIGLAGQNGQLQLNVMGPVAAYKIMESMHVLKQCVDKFRTLCIEPLALNTDRIQENLDQSYCGILALKPAIGYEAASALAKAQKRIKLPLAQLVQDEELSKSLEIHIPSGQLLDALSDMHQLTAEPKTQN
jgi:aspartate ammonia-lyase